MSESDTNSSYFEHQSKSYSSNGIFRCELCNAYIPMRSMEEHIALKHRLGQDETDNNKENMDNRSLRSLLSKTCRKPTGDSSVYSYSSIAQRDRRQSTPIKASDIYKSEFRDSKADNIKSMRNIDDVKAPSPLPRTSRPSTRNADILVAKKQSVIRPASQSNRVNGSSITLNGTYNRRNGSTTEQRRKVPSVFEMFDISRPGDSPDRVFNGEANKSNIRSISATKKTVLIPENNVQCQLCSNVMHKDYLEGHIQRKHNTSNGFNDVNGIGSQIGNGTSDKIRYTTAPPIADFLGAPPMAETGPSKCNICGNLMPKEHIESHIQRAHANLDGNANEANFTRCKYCSAYMHVDYMVGHLLRKHRTDCTQTGSIGILWSQYCDEQVNFWLKDYMVFAKDGALYMAPRNTTNRM